MANLHTIRQWSIKTKFVVSTLVFMLLFAFAIFSVWYSTATRNAEQTAVTYMSELLRMSNQNLEVALKDVNAIISLLSVDSSSNADIRDILTQHDNASEEEQYEDNKKMAELLTRLSTNKYYLNGLMIGGLTNNAFTSGIMMPYPDLQSQPWFRQIVGAAPGERVFIPPHYDNPYTHSENTYNDLVFSYAKTIREENGTIGFVLADIRYQILVDIFNSKVKDNGYIYIADTSLKQMIYPPPQTPDPSFENEDSLEALLKQAGRPSGSFYTSLGGQRYLVIYEKSSFTGWVTLGIIPKHKLLESFYHARDYVLTMTLIVSALAALALFFIGKWLTRNLLKLHKAVARIDREHLEPLPANIRTHDEVGHLHQRINSMIERIRALIEDIRKTETKKRKAEIRLLQNQINPHFLHNTLNTIKFISRLHGMDNILSISESLSTLLHINMDERVFITVSEEIRYIESYLRIQEYKFNNVSYYIVADEEVRTLMTPKLILQPIVENALVHGIADSRRPGQIVIKIYRELDLLKMRVQDNGVGMEPEQPRGIGLQNTMSRIQAYFGEKYGIAIVSQPNVFTAVEISLPILYEEDVMNLD